MSVYFHDTEVDIIGGSLEEGWALVQFEDGTERSVQLGTMAADDPERELRDPIRENAHYRGEDFSVFLPLRMETYNSTVKIESRMGDTLLSEEVDLEAYDEPWRFEERMRETMNALATAMNQPTRYVWGRRSALDDWEEE